MLAALRQRNFALIWLGGLVSLTGNWMLFAALPAYVYHLTRSTLATGAMAIAILLPNTLFGSFAGIFVDRWDRRRTLIASNAALTLIILPLLLVHSSRLLALVFAVAFAESLVAQLLVAEQALLPSLVAQDLLVSANSLSGVNRNASRLIGPALGGVLIAAAGLSGVVVIDAATYAFAGVAALYVRVSAPPGPASVTDPQPSLTGPLHDWLEGLGTIRRQQVLRGLFTVFAASALAEGILAPLFVVFATAVAHAGSQGYGWLLSAQAVGGIGGSVVIGSRGKRLKPTYLVAAGMLLLGLVDLMIWNIPLLAVDLVLMALVGIPVAGFQAGASTLVQLSVPDALLGRIFGAVATTTSVLMLPCIALSGVLAQRFGVVPLLDVSALCDVAAGLAGFAMLVMVGRGAPAMDSGKAQNSTSPTGTSTTAP